MNIIKTYWSKKRGMPGARLVTVSEVDWGKPTSWERYPIAYAAMFDAQGIPAE